LDAARLSALPVQRHKQQARPEWCKDREFHEAKDAMLAADHDAQLLKQQHPENILHYYLPHPPPRRNYTHDR
jgi:hypothetical protein